MNPQLHFSRRAALASTGIGLSQLALHCLLPAATAPKSPLAPKLPHFAPKAKQVILLFSSGGVSQLDLFDPKPELTKRNGELPPEELIKGERFAFIKPNSKLLGSPFKFQKYGGSDMEFSELLPHLSKHADKSTLVRSVKTDNVNHTPAQVMMATGSELAGRPSFGAWTVYGLGSENQDLPAFVDLYSGKAQVRSPLKPAGMLPGVYQAVTLRSGRDPIFYLNNPKGMSSDDRQATITAINQLNRERLGILGDPEIATRIEQYEMAFRMQSAVPELIDLAGESEKTLGNYGVEKGNPSLAANCLLARRLVERGVRFVQLRDGGWDHHSKIFTDLKKSCKNLDQPLAALVQDLHDRGLLDETLVIWLGEFGRTPMVQGKPDPKTAGRDHHKHAFSIWMAGGGLKPGLTYGKTDDLGYHVTEDPVHVHDLHATLLHLLGFDHESLTFPYAGLDYRLTATEGHVVQGLVT